MFSLKKSDNHKFDEIKLVSAKEISFDDASAFKNNISNDDDDDDDNDGSASSKIIEKKNFLSLGKKLRSSLKNRLKNTEYTVSVEFDCKSKNKKLIDKEKVVVVVVQDNNNKPTKISKVNAIKKLFHTPLVSRKKISKEIINLDDDNKSKMKLYNINDISNTADNSENQSQDEPTTPITSIIIDDIFHNLKLKAEKNSDTNLNDHTKSIDIKETILKNNTTDDRNNFCTKKHFKNSFYGSSFSLGDIDDINDNIKTTILTNHNSNSCEVVGALKKDGTYEDYIYFKKN